MLGMREKLTKRFSKKLSILCILALMLAVFAGCAQGAAPNEAGNDTQNGTEATGEAPAETPEEPTGPAEIKGTVMLATTTSTQDSGLLDVLLPEFTNETGWEMDVVAVGSGAAMTMGENGEADVLLVHSPAAERDFVEAGHGPERYDVMYNDYVIIGPKEDQAGLSADAADDAVAAFKILSQKKAEFISRGDESGTHKKELSLWKLAEIEPAGEWYVEAGQGMGAVITMANDMQAYTLSDRATWLSYSADLEDMTIVTQGDSSMFNQYGVIVVDPTKNDKINAEGALDFQTWILGEKAQSIIAKYGVEEFGDPLFTPNATGEPTQD